MNRENDNKSNNVSTSDSDKQNTVQREGTGKITRILAILGIIIIAGLYILSLVASIADWENSFGIFTGALGATIFVPIVIYLIKLFTNKDYKN